MTWRESFAGAWRTAWRERHWWAAWTLAGSCGVFLAGLRWTLLAKGGWALLMGAIGFPLFRWLILRGWEFRELSKDRHGEFLYRPDRRAAARYAMPPRLRPPGTGKDGGAGEIGPQAGAGEVEP